MSPKVAETIARLRADLKVTNDRTDGFSNAGKYEAAEKSAAIGKKLAADLNAILKQTSAYELQIANALWLDRSYPIQPGYVMALTPSYGTVLFPVDFNKQSETSRVQINRWVSDHTNNRILDLLSPGSVDELTKLVITNAVFFKGDWADPFQVSQTRPEPFHQSVQNSVDLPMMQQWNRNSARYGAFLSNGDLFQTPHEIPFDLKDDDPSLYPDAKGHTMLSLDYQGEKIQMILLVPQSADGIAELERLLTYESLQRWIGQMEQRTVNLSIPKFKLEATYPLSKTLSTLGMKRCFVDPGRHPDEGAQFDKLSSTQGDVDRLYISEVLHKSFVDVNEVGTEAAAATAVIFPTASAAPARPKTRPFVPIFKANKPFIFLIRDRETDSILFLGRYVSPPALIKK